MQYADGERAPKPSDRQESEPTANGLLPGCYIELHLGCCQILFGALHELVLVQSQLKMYGH